LPIAAILVLPSVAWAGQPFDAKAFQSSQAAGKAILVDMTAPWCPTCKQQRPIVEEIKERPDLIVCEVDFDKGRPEAVSRPVPEHVVFRGAKEIARSTGKTDPAPLRSLVAKAL
jgi:thioredoxin 1